MSPQFSRYFLPDVCCSLRDLLEVLHTSLAHLQALVCTKTNGQAQYCWRPHFFSSAVEEKETSEVVRAESYTKVLHFLWTSSSALMRASDSCNVIDKITAIRISTCNGLKLTSSALEPVWLRWLQTWHKRYIPAGVNESSWIKHSGDHEVIKKLAESQIQ